MYRISVAVTNAGQRGKTEINQEAWFSGGDSTFECLEVDCVWVRLHEELIGERPGNADQQVGSNSTHYPVYANGPRAKRLPQGHDHQNGKPGYLERRIPAQVAE